MQKTARKLAEFLPFSPIYPDVIKKAQAFATSARNSDIVREFLSLSKAGGGKCFVATAAFDYPMHPTVSALREFRDQVLMPSRIGSAFVDVYYQISPPIAEWLRQHPVAKAIVRTSLQLAVRFFKS
jgi:hypothetical protein